MVKPETWMRGFWCFICLLLADLASGSKGGLWINFQMNTQTWSSRADTGYLHVVASYRWNSLPCPLLTAEGMKKCSFIDVYQRLIIPMELIVLLTCGLVLIYQQERIKRSLFCIIAPSRTSEISFIGCSLLCRKSQKNVGFFDLIKVAVTKGHQGTTAGTSGWNHMS